LTGASHLLAGSFARSPDGLRVQALLYDAATTQLVFSTDASGSAERLPELLCEHIAPAIAANLNESKGDQSLLTVDRDPVYNQLLITGLGNFYAGDLAAAFPAFMKILRDHPDDEAARYWLAKSFHEAEMPHFAVIEMNKYLNQHPDSPRRPEIEAVTKHGMIDNLKVYVAGNLGPNRPHDDLDQLACVFADRVPVRKGPREVLAQLVDKPLFRPPVPVTVRPAEVARRLVLEQAGCSNVRDAVDRRILDDVLHMRTGRVIRSQDDVGGWPQLR